MDEARRGRAARDDQRRLVLLRQPRDLIEVDQVRLGVDAVGDGVEPLARHRRARAVGQVAARIERSEEHTSELQSLMRISYAVFCLKKKNDNKQNNKYTQQHQKQRQELN